MYIVQITFRMHQNLCIVSVQRMFPRNETYLKTKSMNVKGVHCTLSTVYTVHSVQYTLYIVQNTFTRHQNLSKTAKKVAPNM